MARLVTLARPLTQAWERLMRFLTEHNERQIAAWGSSLQYKRRYTNPDEAKRARTQRY